MTLVNTPPPDMTVALLSKGIDAFAAWDPWPIVAVRDVPGAVEIIRGGDVISYLGFNVTTRAWAANNGQTIVKVLAGLSEADQWMRKNPQRAAQVATRWVPGLKQEVAEAAMEFNIQQADRRLSANNYPRSLERAGQAAPAGLPQGDLRREQAHRCVAHPEGHGRPSGALQRSAAHSGGSSPDARLHLQALSQAEQAIDFRRRLGAGSPLNRTPPEPP